MRKAEVMHPELIKAALRMRGSSLSTIAADLGVAPSVVSVTIRYRNRRSRRIEKAIADVLGCKPADIWPDRYERTAGKSAA